MSDTETVYIPCTHKAGKGFTMIYLFIGHLVITKNSATPLNEAYFSRGDCTRDVWDLHCNTQPRQKYQNTSKLQIFNQNERNSSPLSQDLRHWAVSQGDCVLKLQKNKQAKPVLWQWDVIGWVSFTVCFYIQYRTQSIRLSASDVGALGMIGRGGGRYGGASLFGVVEAAVVLVRAWVGWVGGAARVDTAPQEKEDGAHPAAVQREAKRHEALLVVRSDGKPDRRHHPAEPWEERTQRHTQRHGWNYIMGYHFISVKTRLD